MNQQSGQSSKPLKPLEEIGDEWFVNRQEYLDLFWEWGNSIPLPVALALPLLGYGARAKRPSSTILP